MVCGAVSLLTDDVVPAESRVLEIDRRNEAAYSVATKNLQMYIVLW